MNHLKIEEARKFWDVALGKGKIPEMNIVCDHYALGLVAYHASWIIDNKKGYSFVQSDSGQKAFELIKLRSLLDSLGKTELVLEGENDCLLLEATKSVTISKDHSNYVVPFGQFQGKKIEELPEWFVERWKNRDKFEFDDDQIRIFIEVLQSQ